MNTQTLMITGVVAVTLLISGGLMYVVKKIKGISYINIAFTIVSAVKETLYDAGIASNKFSDVLDLIVQALSYVQAICSGDIDTDIKVAKALSYVKDISKELGITLTDQDISIVSKVLALGFTFMDALGLTQKSSFTNLYKRMTKYAGTPKNVKVLGLKYIGR